jgi:hypothetical protein
VSKKKIELLVIFFLLIYSIYCSIIIGPSYDEFAHYKNGEKLFNYIFSFGKREYVDIIYLYHYGLYDFLGSFFSKNFPSKHIIESHHILNLIFSTLSVFGIYQVSKKLFNIKIAKIAFLFCFFNPIFFGHFSINPKDTIIAFSYIWIFYLSIKYVEKQNYLKDRINYLFYLVLLISLGLSIRLTFIFFLAPIFIVLICEIIFKRKKFQFSFNKFLFDLFLILIFSFIITILFWPDTHENLFKLPFEFINNYFNSFFSSNFGLPFGLINGEFYQTQNTPKNYIFTFLFLKMPLYVILLLFFLPFFMLNKNFFINKFSSYKNFIYIFLQIFFPIFLILITGMALNDGLRYILFIIPFICIVASISIFYIFNFNHFFYKFLKFIFFFLFAYNFVIFLLLTPYQYTFINILNGKFTNNFNKFENDYWGTSIKELLVIAKNENIFDKKKHYKIATCGLHSSVVKFYLNRDFDIEYNFVNNNEEYDYIFFINRVYASIDDLNFSNLETCHSKFNNKTIANVSRNGLPLAFISN